MFKYGLLLSASTMLGKNDFGLVGCTVLDVVCGIVKIYSHFDIRGEKPSHYFR